MSFRRRSFAALLARVDSPGAIELAKLIGDEELYGPLMVSSVAFGLPWDKPEEADRFLSVYPIGKEPPWLEPAITWKIATLDTCAGTETRRNRPARRAQLPPAPVLPGPGSQGARRAYHKRAAIGAGLRELDRVLDDDRTCSCSTEGTFWRSRRRLTRAWWRR